MEKRGCRFWSHWFQVAAAGHQGPPWERHLGDPLRWNGSFCLHQDTRVPPAGHRDQGISFLGSTVGKGTVAQPAQPCLRGFELFEQEPLLQPHPLHQPWLVHLLHLAGKLGSVTFSRCHRGRAYSLGSQALCNPRGAQTAWVSECVYGGGGESSRGGKEMRGVELLC